MTNCYLTTPKKKKKKQSLTRWKCIKNPFAKRIYLAKQERAGRNRKGKEKHFLLDMQWVGAERLKTLSL
jgi:hypothetical protein